jgi:hypothetical protein
MNIINFKPECKMRCDFWDYAPSAFPFPLRLMLNILRCPGLDGGEAGDGFPLRLLLNFSTAFERRLTRLAVDEESIESLPASEYPRVSGEVLIAGATVGS